VNIKIEERKEREREQKIVNSKKDLCVSVLFAEILIGSKSE